eukprot:jgi/Mesvir1/4844/Mv11122-RA.1
MDAFSETWTTSADKQGQGSSVPSSAKSHVPCMFKIIVLTYNRPDSLNRALESLGNADYDGDEVSLELFLDHMPMEPMHASADSADSTGICGGPGAPPCPAFVPKQRPGDPKAQAVWDVKQIATDFRWPFGPKRVHWYTGNVGTQGQWLQAWYPTSNDEYAYFVEDDMEVSPYFYQYLKRMLLKYRYGNDASGGPARDPSVYGISLQRQRTVLAEKTLANPSPGDLEKDIYQRQTTPFMYSLVGTWGQLMFPEHWREFRDWYDQRRALGLRPYLPGTKSNVWYLRKGEAIWTPWFTRFIYSRRYFNIYTSLAGGRSLSISQRDAGVNYAKTLGPDALLVQRPDDAVRVGLPAFRASGSSRTTEAPEHSVVTGGENGAATNGQEGSWQGTQAGTGQGGMFAEDWAMPPLSSLPRYDLCLHRVASAPGFAMDSDALPEVLKEAESAPNFVVLLMATRDEHEFLQNWACSARPAGVKHFLLFVPGDPEYAAKLLKTEQQAGPPAAPGLHVADQVGNARGSNAWDMENGTTAQNQPSATRIVRNPFQRGTTRRNYRVALPAGMRKFNHIDRAREQNSLARTPTWLWRYAEFHQERLGKPGTRYLIYQCAGRAAVIREGCGGLGDRFAGIASTLYLAIVTNRVFLIDYSYPAQLIDSLIPNAIDWHSLASAMTQGAPVILNVDVETESTRTLVIRCQGDEQTLVFHTSWARWCLYLWSPALSAEVRQMYSMGFPRPSFGTWHLWDDNQGQYDLYFTWAFDFLFRRSPELHAAINRLRSSVGLPQPGQGPWVGVHMRFGKHDGFNDSTSLISSKNMKHTLDQLTRAVIVSIRQLRFISGRTDHRLGRTGLQSVPVFIASDNMAAKKLLATQIRASISTLMSAGIFAPGRASSVAGEGIGEGMRSGNAVDSATSVDRSALGSAQAGSDITSLFQGVAFHFIEALGQESPVLHPLPLDVPISYQKLPITHVDKVDLKTDAQTRRAAAIDTFAEWLLLAEATCIVRTTSGFSYLAVALSMDPVGGGRSTCKLRIDMTTSIGLKLRLGSFTACDCTQVATSDVIIRQVACKRRNDMKGKKSIKQEHRLETQQMQYVHIYTYNLTRPKA